MKKSILLIAITLNSLIISGLAKAQTLTGYNGGGLYPLYGFSSGHAYPAQTFTLSSGASIGTIGVYIEAPNSQSRTLQFNILTTSSGIPTATIIATQTVSGIANDPTPTLITADFSSQNIYLAAGTYAFSLQNPTFDGITISGDITSTGYAGGQVFTSSDGINWSALGSPSYETGFTVTAVPEPSTYALFGIGVLALVMSARRRRTV